MAQGFKLPVVSKEDPIFLAVPSQEANTWYVAGPGGGPFDYYGGTIYPQSRFKDTGETREELVERLADSAAYLCNQSYAEGYARAQMDIRLALGL